MVTGQPPPPPGSIPPDTYPLGHLPPRTPRPLCLLWERPQFNQANSAQHLVVSFGSTLFGVIGTEEVLDGTGQGAEVL